MDINSIINEYPKIQSEVQNYTDGEMRSIAFEMCYNLKSRDTLLTTNEIWNINLFIRDVNRDIRIEIHSYMRKINPKKWDNVRFLTRSKPYINSMKGSYSKLYKIEMTNEDLEEFSFRIEKIIHQEENDWQIQFQGRIEDEYLLYHLMFEEDRASIILINGNTQVSMIDSEQIETEIEALFIKKIENIKELRLRYLVGDYAVTIR